MPVAERKKRKLFQIAKELNLASQTIREFLEKKGHPIKNPNMPIPEDIYDEILKRFSHEKKEAEKVEKRRKERIREEEIASLKDEELLEKEEAKEIEQVSEQPKEVEPEKEKTPTDKTIEEEVEISSKSEEEAKDDLKEKEKPDVEAVAEEDKKEESKPEPNHPKVGDIIDHPVAKQYLEKKQKAIEKETKKSAKAKKASKSEAEEIPDSVDLKSEAEIAEGIHDETEIKKDKRREKKKEKKKDRLELEEEKEARRRKAFEMIRKESKKFRASLQNLEAEEEGDTELIKKEKEGRRKRVKKKKEVDQKEVDDVLRKTLAGMQVAGTGKKRRKKARDQQEGEEIDQNLIKVTEFISTQDLANLMDITPAEIIQKCLELGLKVTINQRLDMDTIRLLAEEFGFKVEEEEEFGSEFLEELIDEEEEQGDLQPRNPVVTVMGHVDHGKTSVLDYIRKENVVAGESGGITQHIGAYKVETADGHGITFVDTPGHEAFTAMRARGAQITDIVVLVIAADDRVMPQTEEAIDHARAAGVPIVIAINKIDKPNANPEAIKKDLADRNILVEDWGGKYQGAEISAKTGEGMNDLLEKIILEAELLDLKANFTRKCRGVVLEAKLDKGKGPVASVLVETGIVKVGDYFIVGQRWGRVRALLNERGQQIKSAGPSDPIQVLGSGDVPEAGDRFIVMKDEKTVREIATRRQQLKREQDFHKIRLLTLDEISQQIKTGIVKELRLLVKADVDGSAQALVDSLERLSNQDVEVEIIRRAIGPITESDVMLAAASEAIIIGFHVRPTIKAKTLADNEHVDIRLYKIIYDAIEDVKKALEGLLEPVEREVGHGVLEVRESFKISRMGTVAGCYVLEGKITRNSLVRLIRNDVEIYEGKLSSLKRFKDDAKEVQAGYECGVMIENFNDVKVGDHIEAYEIVKEARTLDKATSN